MKREIKFRAWNDKEMVEPFNTTEYASLNNAIESASKRYGGRLMQYTGCKDKNGKEIYEGDVVHYSQTTAMDKKFDYTEAVFYEECHFRTKTFYLCAVGINESYEIIGNIYQNPELLK